MFNNSLKMIKMETCWSYFLLINVLFHQFDHKAEADLPWN